MIHKKLSIIFSTILISLFLISAISAVRYISGCQTLSSSGETYILNQNIVQNSNSDCLKITRPNIILDCNGKSITSTRNIIGVLVDNSNSVTIKNCYIDVGSGIGGYGINIIDSDNTKILENTLNNQYMGLSAHGSNNVRIENNIINNNARNGIYIISGSSNIISGLQATNNLIGLQLYYSSNNLVKDSIITGNIEQDTLISANFPPFSLNNIFLNVKHNKEYVEAYHFSGQGSELIRKWYYKAQVKDTNQNPIKNANVKIKAKNNTVVYDLTTDSNGFIYTVDLFSYINTGNLNEYHYPYEIKVSYNNIETTKTLNQLNDNILNDLIILNIAEESNTSNCNGADLDNDNKVWLSDWSIFRWNFGKRDCSIQNNFCNKADIDKNGKVWLADWGIFRTNFRNKIC
ncbi:carboxypeptidase regulatory-like domain-containing protein [Candidatus Pacearchaeota archaeon]|nr:carboxypeptidase regulatory-like domain-containing protein [Candidatus Pacearchaeota archaeon]